MATHSRRRKKQSVEINDGTRAVTSAEVSTSTQPHGTAQASLHAQAGHLPPGSRASLVDAVLDLAEVQDSAHVEVTVPIGDSESLQRLGERTDTMTTRAAGSTALVTANLPPTGPIDTPSNQSQEEERA